MACQVHLTTDAELHYAFAACPAAILLFKHDLQGLASEACCLLTPFAPEDQHKVFASFSWTFIVIKSAPRHQATELL